MEGRLDGSLLDLFNVDSPDGNHRCHVHKPLRKSVLPFLHQNPTTRLPYYPIFLVILTRLFSALDLLHTDEIIQPKLYRAPEVIFEEAWTYQIDI